MPKLEKRRGPGHGEPMGPGWRFVWLVLYYPVSALFRLRYRHIDRLPKQGPVIVVVNHVSHVDPFLVSKFVLDAGRVPRFLAKESIFAVPAVGWGMRIMGHIPVRRGTTDARQSLAAATRALNEGKVIVLHPEGTVTRDPDGWPMAGKAGAARLAMLAPDVPVVPVAQWGVQEQVDLYHKKIKLFPRPKHVLSVGEPIDLGDFRGEEPTPRVLREITDVIMRRLRVDVAELRDRPAPDGELFHWTRAGESRGDVA
ncbi:1-acyl-sn-glycerol-3-phosphate acyltransferases [Jatrophihabitans endophyticus]|uniref:1-acyl-sn-glycerol-3-phosphate acyltransferases n=1 Tax=Jatrophihabitans endophyticus TaxID=1206085 RepID=A0A1M5D431_9ACTN|nr:lysophospholipid acyltransferase family protein [Jatrophihabitans endophyticus]SHF61738.1 1-acyl-sn-glycerol-3-phosphate acyltransferases [Jatrophihabitans endophyticus]